MNIKLPESIKNRTPHALVVVAIVLVASTLLLLAIFMIFKFTSSPSLPFTNDPESATVTIPSAKASFATTSPWRIGHQHTASLELNFTPYEPIGAAIVISYDPQVADVEDVTTDEFWTQTRIVQKDILADEGLIKLQIIQDPEAEITGDPTLLTIHFSAKNVSDMDLNLTSQSHVYSTEVDQLIPLTADQLTISVTP